MRSDPAARRLYQLLYPFLLIWYAFVVAGLTAVATTWPQRPIGSLDEIPWWSHAIAIAVVAATWAPVSAFLDRGVHQLAFGQRDNAYEVAGHVSRQLLPSVAAALADTMALPYAEFVAADGRVVTAYGKAPEGSSIVAIPLTFDGHELGILRVSARRRRDRLSAADVRLLEDLARQVAMTLYAQQSREQLVTAREEERRRIRRDLHDGLAPTLASLALRLGVLQRSVDGETAAMVAELRADARQATADIRRLVYELRPPMLDEFGLVDALRNLRSDDTLSRTVSAPDPMPALPAAVEVALYRIAAEALHNAARHAGAARCTVELTVAGGEVTLVVTDDGRGLPDDYLAGVGHQSMRERSTELGGTLDIGAGPAGGTRVAVVLPTGAA
ncbi:GAF domain-containing sensor histidine kinase [Actinoplanes bogorensis]|uniref:histidine kinase n=1 Tax=Paractinoplanes bogorensis TaxID=1610840 RepID=A0ABS5YR66_9ACTN|nr:GAF domain-containing sensor histidine kinase [Actinoplanes bogorensis]MBU2665223.1 GAF domain-containing sensor histidine kinase [Actinoplanes bogorensis]